MRLNLLSLIAIVSLTSPLAFAEPPLSQPKAQDIKAAVPTEKLKKSSDDAQVKRKEIIQESTITIQQGRGDRHDEQESFCGKTKEESANACQAWLKEQKASLGDKVLTSTCTQPLHLMGKEKENCVGYLTKGKITYLIK